MHSSISRRKFNSSVIATAVSPFLMSRASAASEEHKTEVIKFSAYSRSATLNRAVRPFNLWGFDDYLFGTPITATLGTTLDVQVHNKLSEETTVHWHGLRTAQLMDGVAKFGSPLIKPNAITHYKVPLVDPGLYWFHSHRRSLNQVARGLYGALLVKDPNAVPLPEQVLILDDWTIKQSEFEDEKPEIDWDRLKPSIEWGHDGLRGRLITINGQAQPELEIPNSGFFRLRLLNAATDRVFRPKIKNANFWIIALDGFDIEPIPLNEASYLGPGQRIDLLVEISEGKTPQLALGEDIFGDGTRFYFQKSEDFEANQSLKSYEIFNSLGAYEPNELRPNQPTQTIDLSMTPLALGGGDASNYWNFNGSPDADNKPLFKAKLGETVRINIDNDTPFNHVIHFHGQHVKVVTNSISAWELNRFRDSVSFPGRGKATVELKAQSIGRWPIHCHMLTHQVSGMNSWYEVI